MEMDQEFFYFFQKNKYEELTDEESSWYIDYWYHEDTGDYNHEQRLEYLDCLEDFKIYCEELQENEDMEKASASLAKDPSNPTEDNEDHERPKIVDDSFGIWTKDSTLPMEDYEYWTPMKTTESSKDDYTCPKVWNTTKWVCQKENFPFSGTRRVYDRGK